MPKNSSGEAEISQMREEDLDEVVEIEKRSFVAPWSKRLFRETLSFPLSFNLVIRKKVDKKVAGYANFYLIGDEVQILNIAVAPESRREGYATRLLGRAYSFVGRARRKGVFFGSARGQRQGHRTLREIWVRDGREEEEILHGNERGRPRDVP